MYTHSLTRKYICVLVFVCVSVLPVPQSNQFFGGGDFGDSESKVSFTSTVCHTKVKVPRLPYNSMIAGE